MIKQFAHVLLTVLLVFPAFGQERRDLTISVSAGKLGSPYYANNTSGGFYSVDFDYSFSNKHSVLVNYLDGEHNYYENVLATDPGYHQNEGTNAKAAYHTFSLLYQYRFLNSRSFRGAVGAGAGIMTHSRIYPVVSNSGSTFQQAVWADLVFPLRLSVDYVLPRNLKLGLMGGFYVLPEFSPSCLSCRAMLELYN